MKLQVRTLVGPTQDAQSPEGSPPARLARAALHLEVDRSRVRILERPAAKPISLARDHIDGLGGAIVGFDAGSPQIVQPPQDVVVPARGERNLRPRRIDDLPG